MTPQIKLTRGSNSLNLTSSPYGVMEDFAPPAVSNSYNISSGTSANVTGGGSLVSQRSNNRPFSFRVRILAANINAASMYMRQIAAFVKNQSSEPLYLEYRENASIPVPLWGQFGAPLRYEIITADIGRPDNNYGGTTGRGFICQIDLEIKPFAIGNRQPALNASGGVFENNYGSVDGTSRSLRISPLSGTPVNKMTNPVFGHTTWNTGWTAPAGLSVTRNTNSAYALPGLGVNAKVTAASNDKFTQSINAGNTNKHSFSAYVIRPDGGAVSSAVSQIYYNVALATTYQNLGNGLWLIYADNIDGINSATLTGINVKKGYTVYLLGYQMEQSANHTPLAYGDLLGCSWTGTAHDSTSSRDINIISVARTNEYMNLAQGTLSIVWKPYYDSGFASTNYFFSLETSGIGYSLNASYDNSTQKFTLDDGINTAQSAVIVITPQTYVMTFVWGPSGLAMYKDGVSIATAATYTTTLANTTMLAIANYAGNNQLAGDIYGLDIYETELTAAQILAMYTVQAAIVDGGARRLDAIPFLWTKDGDGIVDNCDDSTHDNWAVAGGIQGSTDALTQLWLYFSANISTIGGVYLSKFASDSFIDPGNFYLDVGATADANSSGGLYETVLTNNGDINTYGKVMIDDRIIKEIADREFFPIVRFKDAAGTRSINTYFSWGGTQSTAYKAFTASAANFTTILADPLRFPNFRTTFLNYGLSGSGAVTLGANIRRDTGGAANQYLDYMCALWRPICKVSGTDAEDTGLIIEGARAMDFISAVSTIGNSNISITGDVIELTPWNYNNLVSILGNATAANNIANTITYKIYISPRYTLA